MSNKLIILLILQIIITIIGVSAYGSRLAGIKTKQLSTSFSLYNILNLVSRFANMIFLPLLGALVETAIKNNNINLLTNQFYSLLISILVGTVIAILILPTFTNFFERLVNGLYKHKSFAVLFAKEFRWRNIKKLKNTIQFFDFKDIKKYSLKGLPKGSLLILNPIIVAVYTVGYLSSLYAGALVPECRLVASQLSSTVNGIGTILLYLFIDPMVGIISDGVIRDKKEYKEVESLIFYLCIGRLMGVILSFPLLIPLAHFISKIAINI